MKNSELEKALKCLALPPDRQIEYLKNLGTYPSLDELALQFEDAIMLINSTGVEAEHELILLNALLNNLNNKQNSNIWHAKSLELPPWQDIRELSRCILEKIKEK